MPDKLLYCKDCNSEFYFTEGEQNFYKEKGFQNEPQRCQGCRNERKQSKRPGNFQRTSGSTPRFGNERYGNARFGSSSFGSR